MTAPWIALCIPIVPTAVWWDQLLVMPSSDVYVDKTTTRHDVGESGALETSSFTKRITQLSMPAPAVFLLAALAEIAGCFAFWAWARLGRSAWWLLPGLSALAFFAWALTLADTPAAGRAYAAYGGVYIATALGWLWAAEGVRPDRYDLTGAGLCLLGAGVILLAPHRA